MLITQKLKQVEYWPEEWSQHRLPFLREYHLAQARNLLSVGRAVFLLEQASRKSVIEEITIHLEPSLSKAAAKDVLEAIQRLVRFVLVQQVNVSLEFDVSSVPRSHSPIAKDKPGKPICLFSGGLDSLSGALFATNQYKSIRGVYCSHPHQSRVTRTVRQLAAEVFVHTSEPLIEIQAPKLSISGYAQTRGIFYALSGAAVAAALSSDKLLISESGPTMFQPPFAPADSVTMTTHPFVVARTRDIIARFLPTLNIDLQFSELTKAEIAALCPRPELVESCHSCVSQRLPLHDGTCYGCVVRRLGTAVAGVRDTEYAVNPLVDEKAHFGNLVALLEFCRDLLLDRNSLSAYQTGIIDQYRKWELFERYALDNFAALTLEKDGSLIPPAKQLLDQVVGQVGLPRLLDRIHSVRGIADQPTVEEISISA